MDGKQVQHIRQMEIELRALRAEAKLHAVQMQQMAQQLAESQQKVQIEMRRVAHLICYLGDGRIEIPETAVAEAEALLSEPPGYRISITRAVDDDGTATMVLALLKNPEAPTAPQLVTDEGEPASAEGEGTDPAPDPADPAHDGQRRIVLLSDPDVAIARPGALVAP